MACTACKGDCDAGFVCRTCHHRRNVCAEEVGSSGECVRCWEDRELGPQWHRGWSQHKGRNDVATECLVAASCAYQRRRAK